MYDQQKSGERGIAAFKSKISPEKYQVKFDKNNIPDDGMPTQFSSWFRMKVRRSFPIDIESCKSGEKYFKDLWLETKVFIFLFIANINNLLINYYV